jgi:hypothetical protein
VAGTRSFIDILFILLLGTLVMLTHSVPVGAVETELVRLGGGGVSPIRSEDIQLVVVGAERVRTVDRSFGDPHELAATLPPRAPVLLVVDDRLVSHHRVMLVWSVLRGHGHRVQLGAEPAGRGGSGSG